jgi:hyperosmotically inducible periplasmic protein
MTIRALLCLAVGLAIACGRSDQDLEQAVRKQLAADPATANLDLSVSVRGGTVSLSGETRTRAEQARATEIARGTEGVTDVTNLMVISDGDVVDAVRKALAADPVLASTRIEVDSQNGIVRLMSDSTDRAQRERALAVAKAVVGVKGVEDRMK